MPLNYHNNYFQLSTRVIPPPVLTMATVLQWDHLITPVSVSQATVGLPVRMSLMAVWK